MAKKATTIVLILVVVFLLASTVYVSIILTSDTGTTPKQSKASEIDSSVQEASQAGIPNNLGSAPVVQQDAPPAENVSPTQGLVAYANPSPTGANGGNDQSSSSADLKPTDAVRAPADLSPTTSSSSALTDDSLPETGLGQSSPTPLASATASLSPTSVASTSAVAEVTQTQLPATMPVAGAMTTTIVATLIAGITIAFAFLF